MPAHGLHVGHDPTHPWRSRSRRAGLGGLLVVAALSLGLAQAAAGQPAGATLPSEATPPAAAGQTLQENDAALETRRRALAQLDRELLEIREVLHAAHFRTVLGLADALRPRLDAFDRLDARPSSETGSRDAVAPRRVRLEWMVANAELALGHGGRASAALRRARAADPDLHIDERHTSPRLVTLWRALGPASAEPSARRSVAPPVGAPPAPREGRP